MVVKLNTLVLRWSKFGVCMNFKILQTFMGFKQLKEKSYEWEIENLSNICVNADMPNLCDKDCERHGGAHFSTTCPAF